MRMRNSVSSRGAGHTCANICMLRKGARKRKKGGAKERSSSMPVIKANNLSTFSSEDTNHPASNLLSSDTYRKWKCASGGEKQAVVVFEVRSNKS